MPDFGRYIHKPFIHDQTGRTVNQFILWDNTGLNHTVSCTAGCLKDSTIFPICHGWLWEKDASMVYREMKQKLSSEASWVNKEGGASLPTHHVTDEPLQWCRNDGLLRKPLQETFRKYRLVGGKKNGREEILKTEQVFPFLETLSYNLGIRRLMKWLLN